MPRDWRVLCSPKYQTAGIKRNHGKLDGEAEKFIPDADSKLPDSEYQIEEWPAA